MKIFLSLIFLFLTTNLYAADGSSGCGPGWFVFKENSILSSSLRVTTNGILFPTTTIGMTLGTSNCSKHKLVKNEKKSLHYITHNLHELKSEAARGSGNYLTALNEVLGCHDNANNGLIKELKNQYQNVFREESPEEVLSNIYRVILSNEKLATACTLS